MNLTNETRDYVWPIHADSVLPFHLLMVIKILHKINGFDRFIDLNVWAIFEQLQCYSFTCKREVTEIDSFARRL